MYNGKSIGSPVSHNRTDWSLWNLSYKGENIKQLDNSRQIIFSNILNLRTFACMSSCVPCCAVPMEANKGMRIPGTSQRLWAAWWSWEVNSNLGPQKEKTLFLSTVPGSGSRGRILKLKLYACPRNMKAAGVVMGLFDGGFLRSMRIWLEEKHD